MPRWRIEPRLVARKLAVQLCAAVEASGKRVILVTSPNADEGKTFLMRLVGPELERVAPNRFRVLGASELENENPWHAPDDRVLLVDGPPMLEGDGFLELRKGWVSAFEGALIVVMKRRTTRVELEETVDWLKAAKIPPLGVVWNEWACPTLRNRLQLLLQRLTRPSEWMPRRFRRTLRPEIRRGNSP
jgi:hypothetical protein